MHRKLLEVLVDPATGDQLHLADDTGQEEIDEGVLIAPSGASYPIVGGIPRFVTADNYSTSFGLQWNRFAKVQLDSVTGATYSQDRFDAEVPWFNEIDGAWVVDAGCGSGRFAEIAADHGAEVLAVDLSSAVDAVQANLGHRSNVHVLQADLRRLPIRQETIAYLYSIGVLQHTPRPLESARALVQTLPAGAKFAFTIYGRAPWTKLYAKYWWRYLTTRIPATTLLTAIEKAMPIVFPVTSKLFGLPVLGKAFRFVIPVANYIERRDLPRQIRYDEAILDTFDMLAPKYDGPVTRSELEQVLLPFVNQLDFVSDVPVVAVGTRK